jgi:hypothetical protein
MKTFSMPGMFDFPDEEREFGISDEPIDYGYTLSQLERLEVPVDDHSIEGELEVTEEDAEEIELEFGYSMSMFASRRDYDEAMQQSMRSPHKIRKFKG